MVGVDQQPPAYAYQPPDSGGDGSTPAPIIIPRIDLHRDNAPLIYDLKEHQQVVEIHVTDYLEFITSHHRVAFFNAAYRVLVPEGKLYVTVPYYSHPRSFAHPQIQWPPFSEHSFLFLDKQWREAKYEHNVPTLTCDFPGPPSMTYSYGYNDDWSTRSKEFIDFAVEHYWGVVAELYVVLTKR